MPPLPPPTPTKCTPEVVAELCKRLETPMDLATACRGLVHRSVVHDWYRRAAKGEAPYADAVAQIDDARQGLLVAKLREIELLALSGTKEDTVRLNAIKWQLEKLFRDEFGVQRVELTGKDGKPIEISDDPEARRQRLQALLAKAAGPEPADGDGTD